MKYVNINVQDYVENLVNVFPLTFILAKCYLNKKQLMNLQELGFTPFECDGLKINSKYFPEINYTLCESENGTFTISTYEDGNIIVRLPIEHLEEVDQMFSTAEMHITNFKVNLNTLVQSLNN